MSIRLTASEQSLRGGTTTVVASTVTEPNTDTIGITAERAAYKLLHRLSYPISDLRLRTAARRCGRETCCSRPGAIPPRERTMCGWPASAQHAKTSRSRPSNSAMIRN